MVLQLDLSQLHQLVKATFDAAPDRVSPIPGGAGSRKYFRGAVGDKQWLGMFVPDDQPEEATSGSGGTARQWPFLEVQKLLEARRIRVPKIIGDDCARGWLLIEDLGSHTLADAIAERPEDTEALYRKAVVDLARAQVELDPLPDGSIVSSRAFDHTLLRWELDHFREWGLDARNLSLAPPQRAQLDAIFDRLATRVSALPRGFVHRDYQSTNLMVISTHPPELAWIDFQDALLGPEVYDLVALLNDSYQTFDQAFIDARLDDFAQAKNMSDADRSRIAHEFDLVTVQRKLKDAGRFVFIDRVKKNSSYLRWVEPTLSKVRRSLDRLAPDDDDMRVLSELLRPS